MAEIVATPRGLHTEVDKLIQFLDYPIDDKRALEVQKFLRGRGYLVDEEDSGAHSETESWDGASELSSDEEENFRDRTGDFDEDAHELEDQAYMELVRQIDNWALEEEAPETVSSGDDSPAKEESPRPHARPGSQGDDNDM